MRLVVCVKVVPDALAARRIDPDTLRLDRSGDGTINPDDLHAVEEALRLAERNAGEVVLLSMTGPTGHRALRKGLAMGAARAVAVSDERLAGSDVLATSRVLAEAIGRERPDLALFGQAASDSAGALLTAAVAERLGWPALSQVGELSVQGDRLRAIRQTEAGWEVLDAPLPAAVAVTDGINAVRGAPLAAVLAARSKPLAVLSLDDLGVAPGKVGPAGSATRVLGLAPPPARGAELRIDGEPAVAAQALVAALRERGFA